MRRVPEVIFVIDGSFESQAVKEAKSLNLTCFAVSNTNGNTDDVTDLIPANTNSVKSLDYLADALKGGFKAPAKKPANAVKPASAPKKEALAEKKPVEKKETVKTEEK